MADRKSIENLRIYQTSRSLEDSVYEKVKKLPKDEYFLLGNDLRRSSAAVSHYITEYHRRFSFGVKLEALHLARTEAETLRQLLAEHETKGYGSTKELQQGCTGVIKQCWGLIKYIKNRQSEQRLESQTRASDELVAARS